MFIEFVTVVIWRRDDVFVQRLGMNVFVHWWGVSHRADFFHHCVESVMVVCGVLDDANTSIGLVDAVIICN